MHRTPLSATRNVVPRGSSFPAGRHAALAHERAEIGEARRCVPGEPPPHEDASGASPLPRGSRADARHRRHVALRPRGSVGTPRHRVVDPSHPRAAAHRARAEPEIGADEVVARPATVTRRTTGPSHEPSVIATPSPTLSAGRRIQWPQRTA